MNDSRPDDAAPAPVGASEHVALSTGSAQPVDNERPQLSLLVFGSDNWDLPAAIIAATVLDVWSSLSRPELTIVCDDGAIGQAINVLVDHKIVTVDMHILPNDGDRNPRRRRFITMAGKVTHAVAFTIDSSNRWAVDHLVHRGVKVSVLNFDSVSATKRFVEDGEQS